MIEQLLERVIVLSRWILAPFYLGLVLSLFVLLARFAVKVFHLFATGFAIPVDDTIVDILSLVDLCLTANLVMLVIFVGWESSISHFDTTGSKRPQWMQQVGFNDLKLKLLTSIVAIAAIKVLEDFMHLDDVPERSLDWSVGIFLAFVVSALVVAAMGRIGGDKH